MVSIAFWCERMVFYLFCNGISFLTGFFIVFAVFVVFSWFFLNFPRSEFRSGVVGASPPVPSSSILRFKSFIKNHYKCALGALRVYEAFSFEIPS